MCDIVRQGEGAYTGQVHCGIPDTLRAVRCCQGIWMLWGHNISGITIIWRRSTNFQGPRAWGPPSCQGRYIFQRKKVSWSAFSLFAPAASAFRNAVEFQSEIKEIFSGFVNKWRDILRTFSHDSGGIFKNSQTISASQRDEDGRGTGTRYGIEG